jgi:hypothetical protein
LTQKKSGLVKTERYARGSSIPALINFRTGLILLFSIKGVIIAVLQMSKHLICMICKEKGIGQMPQGGGKRGKRLEIDRKDPFMAYDNLDNIVWCCYWCNNAKSNFFNETEFKPIALAIGNSIRKIYNELKGKEKPIASL